MNLDLQEDEDTDTHFDLDLFLPRQIANFNSQHSENQNQNQNNNLTTNRQEVVHKLETFTQAILEDIFGRCCEEDEEVFATQEQTQSQSQTQSQQNKNGIEENKNLGLSSHMVYSWRKLLPVLDLLHDLASANAPRQITKRELFYTNVSTFQTQNQCDGVLQKLCSKLFLHPHMLSVVGHPRGLVRGYCTIQEKISNIDNKCTFF